jgi:hypothetical protein
VVNLLISLSSFCSERYSIPLPYVIFRYLENRTLPCEIRIGARCPWPGYVRHPEFMLPLTERSTKPRAALCNICGRELRLLSATALNGRP